MGAALTPWTFRADLWAAAIAMAWAASYVALDASRGLWSSHRASMRRALAYAGFSMAAASWSAHLLVMADEPVPFGFGYDALALVGALVIGCLLMALANALGATSRRSPLRALMSPVAYGLASTAMPFMMLWALRPEPGLVVSWPWLAAAWAASTLVSALALMLIVTRVGRSGRTLGLAWQVVISFLMGCSVVAGDAGVFHAVQLAESTLSAGRVSPAVLTALAALGVPLLLGLILLTSLLEARLKEMLRRSRTELQRAEVTDPLTGLANRAQFEEALQAEVVRADKHDHRLALVFINLDSLKSINQSFGQAAGDKLLRETAQRLKALMTGPNDLVARAGGDEFLLLLAGDPSVAQASELANRVLTRLNQDCLIDGQALSVPCSIGIAMYPEHGAMSKLVTHANAAMQSIKRSGGAAYCFFEARMVAGAREQVALLNDLRHAIEHQQFEMYYQPKIHAPSGQITGAEALMRWNHPQRGMVSPGVFIPLAERFGLINAMGNWLIEDVCRQIRAWRDQGLRMRVAINLSVHQLRQPDIVQRLSDALKRYRIEPGVVTCEITESTAMEDMKMTLVVLEQLAAIGVHVSIDDFGTGYSSLSYLRQLNAEELKIDRSFVMDLETSEDARAIVDAVVKLAQALGLKVVAEGVETREQQDILSSLGCNELQGYLFAKPMSAKALALWATQDEGGPSALGFRPSLFGDTMPAAHV